MRGDKKPTKIIVKLKSIYTRQYNKFIKCLLCLAYSPMTHYCYFNIDKDTHVYQSMSYWSKENWQCKISILFGFIDIVCSKQTSCKDIQL